MRERRSLQPRREKRHFVVRLPVDDQSSARRERKCGALFHTLECFGRYDCDHGEISAQCARCVFYCGRERNIVSESKQCLPESFEQRHIRADQNYFCHCGVTLLLHRQSLNRFQLHLADLDYLPPRGEPGHDAHIAPRDIESARKKVDQGFVRQPFGRRSCHAHLEGGAVQAGDLVFRCPRLQVDRKTDCPPLSCSMNGETAHISLNSSPSRMLSRMKVTIGLMSSPPRLGMMRRNGARIGSLSW